jgi:hypothetical protein
MQDLTIVMHCYYGLFFPQKKYTRLYIGSQETLAENSASAALMPKRPPSYQTCEYRIYVAKGGRSFLPATIFFLAQEMFFSNCYE